MSGFTVLYAKIGYGKNLLLLFWEQRLFDQRRIHIGKISISKEIY